jgi:hypothetical protein
MFIPKFVYENAPYYWIVLGVLLIGFGIYYFQAGNQEYFLAGIGGGAFSLVWGLLVLRRRLAQETRQPCSTYDDYLDQTCELNLNSGPVIDRVPRRTETD